MANVAVTCIKNGRSDSFGRPLVSGTYYPSVEIETAKALWNAGYVSVADAAVFDDDPLAGTSPLDDFNIARALSLSRQPAQTSANLAAELAAIGMSLSDAAALQQTAIALGSTVVPAPPSPIITAGSYSGFANATPFCGWGCLYRVPSSTFAFTHIRVMSIAATAATNAQKWKSLVFNVRAGSQTGAIIATGTYDIPVFEDTLSNILVPLSTTVTAALCGGLTYFIEYTALNSSGGFAVTGRPTVHALADTMSNAVSESSWYQTNVAGGWFKASLGSDPVGYTLALEPCISQGVTYSNVADGQSPVIVAPPLFAVVGRECNLYFDGLGEALPRNIVYDVVSTAGVQQSDRWTYTPAYAGSLAISIDAKNPWTMATLATASTTVFSASDTAAGSATLLCVGDSTTAAGTTTAELVVLGTADANLTLTLIGTQGSGANKHEGRSGWTAAQFVGASSPFYNAGVVDFANYLSANSLATPTHVTIALGINDIFSATTDVAATAAATDCAANISKLVYSIQNAAPAAKIGIALTIPPSSEQNAFGKNYNSDQNLFRYSKNRQILLTILSQYFASKTASLVYLLPFSVSLDTKNNMVTETVAVNSRNAATVVRQSNGVHPATSGYNQIADVVYAWLKNTL